ncbi:MAG TPA: hypothetical protein VJO16_20215 [Candidatus Acidoferrum sp.]|nr:hypothetical protein [Candidatus Acidoferrum sp.]
MERFQVESLEGNLRWLDLPDQLESLLTRVAARAAMIEPAGFEDVVFVAIGDSNLAVETILRLPNAKIGQRSFLLDTIDPDSIRALDEMLRLDKTVFVFANKAGNQIEIQSLLLYFLKRLKMLGIDSPACHLITATEENSYLGEVAGEYNFLDSFLDPPGIHRRFSSLIHFNGFLTALCRLDPSDLLARTQAMREACWPAAPQESNPAVTLAAFLAATEMEGRDRLIFFSGERLNPTAQRIGYLVGASTGKKGHGILPAFGFASSHLSMIQQGCSAVILKFADEEEPQLDRRRHELREAGVPMVAIELHGPEELAAELFKWEIATALACSLIGVDPFHDPDIRESRTRAAQILEQLTTGKQSPLSTVRVREGALELFAEGETRQQISTLNMTEALRTLFGLRHRQGYIALLPFLNYDEGAKQLLHMIREKLESVLELPVLITPGPRYIQAVGQVYLGGPPKGLILLLTAAPEKDLAIPGADYSFGQLQLALALGEFESLGRRRSPVIRWHLSSGAKRGLVELDAIITSALGKTRLGPQ